MNIGHGKVPGFDPPYADRLTDAICSHIVLFSYLRACGGIKRRMPRAGRLLTILKFTEKPVFAVNFVKFGGAVQGAGGQLVERQSLMLPCRIFPVVRPSIDD
jgi:hypothetical protein